MKIPTEGIMKKVYPIVAFGLGGGSEEESSLSKNHFAGTESYSDDIKQKIASWGLTRVAGNTYVCPSTADFWAVTGGKIVKLVGKNNVVDNHESIPAASDKDPQKSVYAFLDDITF